MDQCCMPAGCQAFTLDLSCFGDTDDDCNCDQYNSTQDPITLVAVQCVTPNPKPTNPNQFKQSSDGYCSCCNQGDGSNDNEDEDYNICTPQCCQCRKSNPAEEQEQECKNPVTKKREKRWPQCNFMNPCIDTRVYRDGEAMNANYAGHIPGEFEIIGRNLATASTFAKRRLCQFTPYEFVDPDGCCRCTGSRCCNNCPQRS